MPEGRMLKKRISESKKLGNLKSDSARLLYTWLIPWLDVEDRHSADPEIIKGHVFPKIKSMTTKKIERLILELNDVYLIILYSANGELYLQFKKSLQKIHKDREAPSTIPDPKKGQIIKPTHANSCAGQENSSQLNESKVKGSKDIVELGKKIIDYFNETTKQKRSYNCEETNKFINGRIEEGRAFKDFKHVIDTKTAQWLDDPKMRKFLRPSTLFRPGKFEDYVNEPYEDPKKKPEDLKEKKKREFNAIQKKALEGK